ncbi:hypothetical protein [Halostagnicola sp. A-GB9-2]|uniref:hypothetical protein n=1 Tax=Halostagnicola sp. A-GB9-2 TaxID=3048066 RepID=UPI0024C045BE|nr:hypothetical protein [Halostagnicola sp. A-GB9-2]MDJ1431240.1 hypothetical protein [Halostagnicola sp. A-GB9-2]
MSMDRYEAERRRFARLLGLDAEIGSGLPIGSRAETEAKDVDTPVSKPGRNAD